MRKVLLAAVLLGCTVAASGQTASRPHRGQFTDVDNAWWRAADVREGDTMVSMQDLLVSVNGLELRADEATALRATAADDTQVFTLTGTVTLTIPAGGSGPGE